MPNANYVKGRRKEYKIVNKAREEGHIAFRSAGSHSPIDVCVIDLQRRTVDFIQCKPESISESAKIKLHAEMEMLKGFFCVKFSVI